MADTKSILRLGVSRRDNQTYPDANTPRELAYYLNLSVEHIRAANGDFTQIRGAVLDIMAQCAGWLERSII